MGIREDQPRAIQPALFEVARELLCQKPLASLLLPKATASTSQELRAPPRRDVVKLPPPAFLHGERSRNGWFRGVPFKDPLK
jgi:hypothetical protein